MKKFIVLYYSPAEAMAKMQTASKEEMKAGQKAWMDWFVGIGDGLVDRGEYFSKGAAINSQGWSDVSGKVTGYSIIQANDFDTAKDMVKNHPHINWFEGCSVEVHEPMVMGQ